MAKPVPSDWNVSRLNLEEAPGGFPGISSITTLHGFWAGKFRDGRLPSRADFPIEELRPWIGDISLVDVEHAPRRFRWRLIGTNIVTRMGRDSTGRWFDELYTGEILAGYVAAYSAAVDRRAPVFYRGDLEFVGRDYLGFDSVHLPLSDEGAAVNMLMLCLSFDAS